MNYTKEIERRFSLQEEYLGVNKPVNKIQPLVSVSVAAYLHENYIEQCLDSILMQETNFPFEVIVGEDDSTDNTRQICIEYAEKYPDKIRLFLRDRKISHLYSEEGKLIKRLNGVLGFGRMSSRGKYIATCEGDDYWTDPLKLQKQVDFLEKNQEYGFVCSSFKSINHLTGEEEVYFKNIPDKNSTYDYGIDINLKLFWENWCIQILTFMYRSSLYDLKEFGNYNYKHAIDMHFFYHLIKQKKGFYFKEVLGNQNVIPTGIYSHKNNLNRAKTLYQSRSEISRAHPKDRYLKTKLFSVASELFVNKDYVKEQEDLSRIDLFKDMIRSLQDFNDFKHLMICLFFPNRIKS